MRTLRTSYRPDAGADVGTASPRRRPATEPPAADMITLIRPMLATLVPKPFHRPGWVYEEKYDGIRTLAYRRRRRIRLYSRNLNDLTAEFPDITRALQGLVGGDFVLDGEIVAF